MCIRDSLRSVCVFRTSAAKQDTHQADGPKVYVIDNEPEVVISLFAQGDEIAGTINNCCENTVNPQYGRNIILYSDFADFYADEGLSLIHILTRSCSS